MRFNRGLVIISLACLAMTGCDVGKKAAKAPAGQVVATVDGEEITQRELAAELEGMKFPDAKTRKAAEQAALQGLINRKLMAKAAVAAELDKSPDFALQKQRVEELLLAQSLQKKILKDMPAPTREEAQSFVTSHPDLFLERKIFDVEQIRIARPSDPALLRQFEPLKSLEEVKQFLGKKNIKFEQGDAKLDTAAVNPDMAAAVVKLPPGEVFIVPTGQLLLINRIRSTRIEPFTGEPAIKQALELLKARRSQETLARQFEGIKKAAAGKIQYGKDYQPPAPPAAKAAAKAA